MIWSGYTPQTILPVVGVLALILALLYLIRVRRRAVTVPYLGIWTDIIALASSRRWHERLKRFVSYMLWLLILSLIALALMDPRQEVDEASMRHVAIIVDTTASMAAVDEGSTCGRRLDCAIQKAEEIIGHMKTSDRAVIIAAGARVESLSGPLRQDKDALLWALKELKTQPSDTSLQKALDLAVSMTKGRAGAEIIVLSDGQFEPGRLKIDDLPLTTAFEQQNFAKVSGNLSIDAFNVRRYLSNRLAFELFVKVTNHYDLPVTAKLEILSLDDGQSVLKADSTFQVIAEKTLTLASGDEEIRIYDKLNLLSGQIVARITITDPAELYDPMPDDDIAYAVIPDFAKPQIACVTPGNLFLEAALLLNENYQTQFFKISDPSLLNPEGKIDLAKLTAKHDIVILDNSYYNMVAVDSSAWTGRLFLINPDKDSSPFASKTIQNPIIERSNSKHPISKWLSLKNINIAKANVFSGVASQEMVLRAIEGPVIATRKKEQQRTVAVGFSLVESDLIFRVALPILVINAIDWLLDEGQGPMRGRSIGESWGITVPEAIAYVDVEKPSGVILKDLPNYRGQVKLWGDEAGFYRLNAAESLGSARTYRQTFAANFTNIEAKELALQPQRIESILHEKPSILAPESLEQEEASWLLNVLEKLPKSAQQLWVLALLLVVGLLYLEFLTYHRRWTV